MAEICPFCGVRYNQELVADLASVICPIYDVTTPQMQQELYHRSGYNFIRLEHGRELPQDNTLENKYTRSAAALEQWLAQGVLRVDPTPAVYLYDQYFRYRDREYRRRSMYVAVRLEEWDKMVVRPHEGTLAQPKGDRLSLLWACQANTSPVLALFEDKGKRIASVLALAEKSEPVIDFGLGEEKHRLWAITGPEAVARICRGLEGQPIYIADGHHRYESALQYQRERAACAASPSGDEPFNFVMMTLVDFADPGLLILPPHRLVRGISRSSLDEFQTKLEAFFEIDRLPLDAPDVWQQVAKRLNGEELVAFGLAEECLLVLKLRDPAAASRIMPYFHSDLYKRLDVSVVDHIILEELLGLGGGREEARIAFSYDQQDAVNRVLDQEYQLALLLSPVRPETIKAIADTGDRMPRKSTYFYPKLPAGLVFRRLD